MFQWFFSASAIAGAAAFRAFSKLTAAPYGFGICARAIASPPSKITATTTVFTTVFSDMLFSFSSLTTQSHSLLTHILTPAQSQARASFLALDRHVNRSRSEHAHQKPSKTPRLALRLKLQVISRRNFQLDRLPVPGIVHAQTVMPCTHRHRNRISIKKLPNVFPVHLHDNLPLLHVIRRFPPNRNRPLRFCGCGLHSGSFHQQP